MQKQYLEEQQLLLDSFRLGVKIVESGFRPTIIVGIWRGGSTTGIYVQECLQTLGIKSDHIAIRTSYRGESSYAKMVSAPESNIRVHGTEYLIENLNTGDNLLIVDDVFSTGLSLQAVKRKLKTGLRRNYPLQVKFASLYQRPSFNRTTFSPDYCLHKTEDWLVFPYELNGLTHEEISRNKPYLGKLLCQTES